MFPREILNKIKWTGNPELEGIEIWILHRGAPGDRKVVEGGEVRELEHSFFLVDPDGDGTGRETRIPYHRIQRILLDKEVIYNRSEYSHES